MARFVVISSFDPLVVGVVADGGEMVAGDVCGEPKGITIVAAVAFTDPMLEPALWRAGPPAVGRGRP